MTDAPTHGCANQPAPTPLILPPAANGYRRSLFPGRGVSVYYDRHPPNEWGEHTHEQTQVSGILEAVECLIKWQTPDGLWHNLPMKGPAVWVIPALMPHSLSYPAEADMVTLFMEQAFVLETLGRDVTEFAPMPLEQLASRDTVIGQLTKTFRRLCRGKQKANALYVESIGTVLGTHILQVMFGGGASGNKRGGLPDDAQLRVMRYIEEHLANLLDLVTLGRVAGFTACHFGRLFKKSLGRTPHDYVMRRRVAKAEELLETTDRKQVEIAELCGFSDDTHMARRLRRLLGCSPSEVRSQRRK